MPNETLPRVRDFAFRLGAVTAAGLLTFAAGLLPATAADGPAGGGGSGAVPSSTPSADALSESFERGPFDAGSGLPTGWRLEAFTPGLSRVEVLEDPAADGNHFLRITSEQPNHASVVIPVGVQPQSLYRFSASVRASATNADVMAAVLGVRSQYAVSPTVRTNTSWQPLELYVRTGIQNVVEFTASLGHFGQPNSGTADFDQIAITKVTTVAPGATVVDFAPAAAAAAPADFDLGATRDVKVLAGILAALVVLIAVGMARTKAEAPNADRAG